MRPRPRGRARKLEQSAEKDQRRLYKVSVQLGVLISNVKGINVFLWTEVSEMFQLHNTTKWQSTQLDSSPQAAWLYVLFNYIINFYLYFSDNK